MKYIMLLKGQQRYPIIFPEDLVHIEVAEHLKDIPTLSGAEVVSAGTVLMVATAVDGKSSSLKVRSAMIDSTVINVWDYSRGHDIPTDAQTEHLIRAKVAHDLLIQLGLPLVAKSMAARLGLELDQ